MAAADHFFGSFSTGLKLKVVEDYLKAYTLVLKNQGFETLYIDAFAGTGERTEHVDGSEATLFEGAVDGRLKRHRGSAKIAIDVEPPFTRIVFIEKNSRHVAALRNLQSAHPERDIEIIQGSANEELRKLLTRTSWRKRRAVLFLDPYGMDVSWETLQLVKKTKAVDLWYLVSLSGLFRQAARNQCSLDAVKRVAITRMLGTDAWEGEWYQPNNQKDLFEGDEPSLRTADIKAIEEFAYRRLKDLFKNVSRPLQLRNAGGVQMFSLFFAISNESGAAVHHAMQIANHILTSGRSSQTRSL